MGLDGVELLMEIEDAFEIEIPDSAERIKTVADLNALITKILNDKLDPGVCANVVFALRLRRGLMAVTGVIPLWRNILIFRPKR